MMVPCAGHGKRAEEGCQRNPGRQMSFGAEASRGVSDTRDREWEYPTNSGICFG